MGYRELIRNLRTGQTLKIMQPPETLAALAHHLNTEEKINAKICPPGTPELPYINNSKLWRISSHLPWAGHFELSIDNGNILIRKCQLEDDKDMARDGRRPYLTYKSDQRGPITITIPLNDPDSIPQTVKVLKSWRT